MSKELEEFITKFDAKPDWKVLIQEEAKEVLEAAAHLLKELADLVYVIEGADVAGQLDDDEMSKEVYRASAILAKSCSFFSEDVREEAFRRVHQSNMSKLGDDGKPIRREDGKILKGPNYKPADLSDLV